MNANQDDKAAHLKDDQSDEDDKVQNATCFGAYLPSDLILYTFRRLISLFRRRTHYQRQPSPEADVKYEPFENASSVVDQIAAIHAVEEEGDVDSLYIYQPRHDWRFPRRRSRTEPLLMDDLGLEMVHLQPS